MSTTTARARTTLPIHSTGWQALRIITDRAGKYYKEGPADWLKRKHRKTSVAEVARILRHYVGR